MNPRSYLRLMREEWALIVAIYQHSVGGFIDYVQLIGLIEQHKFNETSVSQVYERLIDADVVSQPLSYETRYQLGSLARCIVEELLQVQQLGVSDNIVVYVENIRKSANEVSELAQSNNPHQLSVTCTRLSSIVSQIRAQLRNNLSAIHHLCAQAKQTDSTVPVAKRYAEIIGAWNSYIIPIGEMVDIQGVFHEHLEQAQSDLRFAVKKIKLYSDRDRVSHLVSQIADLEGQILVGYQAAKDTLKPLYEIARRNSQLTRGASLVIDALRRKQVDRIPQPVWSASYSRPRQSMMGTGRALLQYVMAFLKAQNTPPPVIVRPDSKTIKSHMGPPPCDLNRAVSRIRESLPVDDLLGWVTSYYYEEDVGTILDILLLVRKDNDISVVIEPANNIYESRTHKIISKKFSATEML